MRNRLILVLIVLALAGGLGWSQFGADKPATPEATPVKAVSLAAPVPVEFDLVRLSREGMGVIAGSAAPGGFVDVMSEGRSIGKSRASETGAWEIVVDSSLSPGTHVLSLTATDGNGGDVRSANLALVGVPPPPSEGPALKTAKGEKKPVADEGVLAVLLPRQGAGTGRVLQRPGLLKPTLALGIDLADFDDSGKTVLRGRANAGNTVNVYIDGRPAGTAKAGDESRWSLTVPHVTAGPHNIRLEEIDAGNAVVQNVDQAFNPAITLAVDDGGAAATILPARTVWHVVRRQPGGALRYAQVFRADQGVAQEKDGDGVKMPGILKPGSDI
ncbi:hypothetical protein [Emcibacter sp. SYSU 3D8]|uniref:hypothetical protein n=1 Tax=Emcibacter sp. SYSU 3D8 TaxID=3133969 RepID=UPI0031FEE988